MKKIYEERYNENLSLIPEKFEVRKMKFLDLLMQDSHQIFQSKIMNSGLERKHQDSSWEILLCQHGEIVQSTPLSCCDHSCAPCYVFIAQVHHAIYWLLNCERLQKFVWIYLSSHAW